MKTIKVNDWTFNVDFEQTIAFYQQNKKKFSNICTNDDKLKTLILDLGIDLSKPVSISEDGYEAIYVVFGTAKSNSGFEIDFIKNGLSILVLPDDECTFIKKSISTFTICIENINAIVK